MDMDLSIQFLGAAGTVTGSKYLIKAGKKNILVDCGLFQGLKELRELNWASPAIEPRIIDAILLTHGHLDHVGYLPRLVKFGFKGPVLCTAPTAELAAIIIEDSARLQEEEALKANQLGYSKHHPAQALYTSKDVKATLPLFQPVKDNEWVTFDDKIKFRFLRNGHIIGSSCIEMDLNGKIICFSGDIGRFEDEMFLPPWQPQNPDYLIIESTYGNRIHPIEQTNQKIKEIILENFNRSGTLVIPSFTVDRAQDIMYHIWVLKVNGEIPDIPVFLDSPMAHAVSKLYQKYSEWNILGSHVLNKIMESVQMIRSVKETEQLSKEKQAKIIIAGSGMMNGGRVLEYLKTELPKPGSTILITGFQAEGTRGRLLKEGAHEIKIEGVYYPVKAKIESIATLSSHADQSDIIKWVEKIGNAPEKIFITHGEPMAANALRVKLKDTKGWHNIVVPKLMETISLKGK
jgi:metallo-beta-lactamase family protein